MCLTNFIGFRVEYFELKKKLEFMNDTNVEKKLRNFVETKVYGASDTSEDHLKAEYNTLSVQESQKNLTEKRDGGNDYNYNLECKTEKVEYEDIEEYKLHTKLDIEDNEDEFEQPVPVEHVKIESYIEEDIRVMESSSENKLLDQSKSTEPYKTDEVCDITNQLVKNKKRASVKILNKNAQSTNKEISDLECNICGKTFPYISKLNRHMRVHTGEKPYICNTCNKSFAESSHLKAHTAVHIREKRYSCNMCSKIFATRTHLKHHELLHTKGRRYICNICNRGFCFSNRLKNHMLIHTDEKPYKCLICKKTFKRLQYMKEHERVHTGEKPYACSMCDKTFSLSGNLKNHELVHTGEKPYTCGICHKSFRVSNTLKRHKRVHTNDKPVITCGVCNKTFTTRSNLKNHEVVHATEKRHVCNVCSKRFHRLSRLKKHMLLHTVE